MAWLYSLKICRLMQTFKIQSNDDFFLFFFFHLATYMFMYSTMRFTFSYIVASSAIRSQLDSAGAGELNFKEGERERCLIGSGSCSI